MLITVIAALFSLVLVEIALPSFNLLTHCPVYIPWRSPVFWGIMIGYVIVTGLLAGSRPGDWDTILLELKPVSSCHRSPWLLIYTCL